MWQVKSQEIIFVMIQEQNNCNPTPFSDFNHKVKKNSTIYKLLLSNDSKVSVMKCQCIKKLVVFEFLCILLQLNKKKNVFYGCMDLILALIKNSKINQLDETDSRFKSQ